jgi:hypothetical protein
MTGTFSTVMRDSTQFHATPLSSELVYTIFFSSVSNLLGSVRNLSSQCVRKDLSFVRYPWYGSGSLIFGLLLHPLPWLARSCRMSCRVSLLMMFCPWLLPVSSCWPLPAHCPPASNISNRACLGDCVGPGVSGDGVLDSSLDVTELGSHGASMLMISARSCSLSGSTVV